VQGLVLLQVIEQVMGDRVAGPGQAAEQPADRLVPSQLTTVAGLLTELRASSRGCSWAGTSPLGPASKIRARSAKTQLKQRLLLWISPPRPHSRQV
jgi:hypothetical protein